MQQPEQPPRGRLRDVAEDATGFGAAERRMTRDLLLRPDAVLVEQGQPGSPYPKPLRYYLTLTGLYLVLIAVLGGFERVLGDQALMLLQDAVAASGKSQDAFTADLDQWYSLLAVPALALGLYPPLRFLFGRWSGARPDGQAFVFLSGWTLLAAPLGLIGLVVPSLSWLSSGAWLPILIILMWRMGRGVWWTTRWQLVRRTVVAGVVIAIAQTIAATVAVGLALAGAVYGP